MQRCIDWLHTLYCMVTERRAQTMRKEPELGRFGLKCIGREVRKSFVMSGERSGGVVIREERMGRDQQRDEQRGHVIREGEGKGEE